MFPPVGRCSRYVAGVTDPISAQSWSYSDSYVVEDELLAHARERAERLTSSAPTPDLAYVDRTFDGDIEVALATLPPDFRAAVVLCDVEGLTYEEIAEILGTKLGTVRSRIHRGRGMLRTALAHRAPGAGRLRYAGPEADQLLSGQGSAQ